MQNAPTVRDMQRCIFILCKKSAEDMVICGRNSHRRRSESFNLRSSQFKICFMGQQQEITYQYDLFNQTGQDVIRPFAKSEAVRGAQGSKGVASRRSRLIKSNVFVLFPALNVIQLNDLKSV